MGPGIEGDRRVVYGATCAWWDYIDKVAVLGNGLPCCPHCKGVLFELDRGEWEEGIEERMKKTNNPGYPIFMTWLKGKCFRNLTEAFKVFEVRFIKKRWREG